MSKLVYKIVYWCTITKHLYTSCTNKYINSKENKKN